MGKLAEHLDEIEMLYFIEGWYYQELADRYGTSKEAIRQFLNRNFPDRPSGWEWRKMFRAELRDAEDHVEIAERTKDAPRCIICDEPVLRRVGGNGKNRTCCHAHAVLWSLARFLLDEGQRENQRRSTARSVLRYPKDHEESELKWARRVLRGAPRQRTYARKDSKAFAAYLEVLRIRGDHEHQQTGQ